MKEPGRYDITPKRKPVFRIQPSVGKQGMTIEQPFSTPAAEEGVAPAEEAPAAEVADLVTPAAEPGQAAHPAETAASEHDYTRYQTESPEEPAAPAQNADGEFSSLPSTGPEQPEGASYHDADNTEYSAPATTEEYAVAAEYQDPAYTGYYLEPGTPEYDAYYAAVPAVGMDEYALTEDTQSQPPVYDAAAGTEYTAYSDALEYQAEPTDAEGAASLVSWDQAPAPDPGQLTLPGAFVSPGSLTQSNAAPALKPSPGQRSPLPAPAVLPPRSTPTEDPRARTGFPFWSLALASLVFLALGAAGGSFFSKPVGDVPAPGSATATITATVAAGRPSATPPLVESTSLKNSEQEAVDAAFAANKAGDFEGAVKRFTDLQARHPNWVSMGIEIGRSQLYQHDLAAAGTTLKDALSKGRAPSDAQFLMGLLFMTNSAFQDAESNFAKAVAMDPARPDFYYFWGELLRREGKPLEAASKFRSALLRNQYETAEGLYRLKMWLSDIQADQEKTSGASAQIDAGLAQARPPMEALLAGAVRSIKAGQVSEAAVLLGRARQVVEPTVFFVVMQDPSLSQESWRPELAAFFKPEPDAAAPADPPAISAVPAQAAKPARGR